MSDSIRKYLCNMSEIYRKIGWEDPGKVRKIIVLGPSNAGSQRPQPSGRKKSK